MSEEISREEIAALLARGSEEMTSKQEYMERMSDNDLARYLLDYARHRDGEIAALTRAAAIRIDVLAARVRILEGKA